jgi:hypothetical protein
LEILAKAYDVGTVSLASRASACSTADAILARRREPCCHLGDPAIDWGRSCLRRPRAIDQRGH